MSPQRLQVIIASILLLSSFSSPVHGQKGLLDGFTELTSYQTQWPKQLPAESYEKLQASMYITSGVPLLDRYKVVWSNAAGDTLLPLNGPNHSYIGASPVFLRKGGVQDWGIYLAEGFPVHRLTKLRIFLTDNAYQELKNSIRINAITLAVFSSNTPQTPAVNWFDTDIGMSSITSYGDAYYPDVDLKEFIPKMFHRGIQVNYGLGILKNTPPETLRQPNYTNVLLQGGRAALGEIAAMITFFNTNFSINPSGIRLEKMVNDFINDEALQVLSVDSIEGAKPNEESQNLKIVFGNPNSTVSLVLESVASEPDGRFYQIYSLYQSDNLIARYIPQEFIGYTQTLRISSSDCMMSIEVGTDNSPHLSLSQTCN